MSKWVTLPKVRRQLAGRAQNAGSLGPGAMLLTITLCCPHDLAVTCRKTDSTSERSGVEMSATQPIINKFRQMVLRTCVRQ